MISSGHSKCDTSFAWRRSFSFFGCGGGSGWSSGGANSCVSGLAACSSLSGLNEGVLGVSRRAVGRKEASEANIAKDKAGPMSPSCLFGGLGAVSRITVTYVLQGLSKPSVRSFILAPTPWRNTVMQREEGFSWIFSISTIFHTTGYHRQSLSRMFSGFLYNMWFLLRFHFLSIPHCLARSSPRSNAFLFTSRS